MKKTIDDFYDNVKVGDKIRLFYEDIKDNEDEMYSISGYVTLIKDSFIKLNNRPWKKPTGWENLLVFLPGSGITPTPIGQKYNVSEFDFYEILSSSEESK